MRYRLLETIREFAAGQLDPDESRELAQRHTEYLVALAETAEPHLQGPQHAEWLDRLEVEHDNLRAALDWCVKTVGSGQWAVGSSDQGMPVVDPDSSGLLTAHCPLPTALEIGLRLGAALAQFWLIRGHLVEGRTRLAALLETAQRANLPIRRSRARAQAGAGALALHHGEYETARSLLEASLTAARALDDLRLLAFSLLNLGVVEERTWHHPRANACIEEALAIYRRLGDERTAATCLMTLADMARHQLDHEPARTLYREACAILRGLGDQRGTGWALTRLGSLAVWDGRLEEARADHEEALTLFREMEDRIGIAAALNFLGEVALPRRELQQARQLFQESLSIWRELGSRRDMIWSLKGLGAVALAEADFRTARACIEESLTLGGELGTPLGDALAPLLTGKAQLLEQWEMETVSRPDRVAARDCFEMSLTFARVLGSADFFIHILGGVGRLARDEGDDEAARRFYQESLLLRREIGHRYAVAQSLEELAALAGREQQAERAIRLLGAAEAFGETLGGEPPDAGAPDYEQTVAAGRAELGEAAFAAAWAEGRAMSLAEAVDYALEAEPVRAS